MSSMVRMSRKGISRSTSCTAFDTAETNPCGLEVDRTTSVIGNELHPPVGWQQKPGPAESKVLHWDESDRDRRSSRRPQFPLLRERHPEKKVKVSRFPSASSPGQNCRAMDSLIRTTAGLPAMSVSLKSRPRRMGMCSALMYPGLVSRTSTSGCSDIGTVGRPSIAMG